MHPLLQPLVYAEGLLDFLYPRVCLHCDRPIRSDDLPLCSACFHQLEPATKHDVRARLARLPAADGLFEHAFCLWTFDDGTILRSVQHAFKYQNLPAYAESLGVLIGKGYEKLDALIPDMIIPVPLHQRRKLTRGYNQSYRLAKGISSVLDSDICTDLRRIRTTKSQTDLNRKARWNNVSGAFELTDHHAVTCSSVLLVDDVLTTGSTLAAAASPLLPFAECISFATLGLARA